MIDDLDEALRHYLIRERPIKANEIDIACLSPNPPDAVNLLHVWRILLRRKA